MPETTLQKRIDRPNTSFILKLIFTLSASALLIYFGTLKGEFVFDDFARIVDNPGLRDPLTLKKIVTVGMPSRPFLMLTLAANKTLGGFHPFGYHLFNIIIHTLNATLLFFLVTRFVFLLGKESRYSIGLYRYLPVAASAIFLLHPIQTESVSYSICRSEELSALFYLLSIFFYLKAADKRNWPFYGLTFLFALLGVFTKEVTVTLPAVIFLMDYFFLTGGDLKRSAKKFIIFLPLHGLIFFLAITLAKMDAGVGIYERGVYSTALTQASVVVYYMKLLFFPVSQTFDYNFPVFKSFWEFPVPLSFLFIGAILVIAVLLNRKQKLLSFSLLWFFITLSPTSSVVPIDDLIFEHRLYLPSVGFSVFQAILLVAGVATLKSFFKGFREPQGFFLVSALLFSLLSVNTINRNKIYKNSLTFWEDAVKKSPWKDRPNTNLSSVYGHMRRYEEAEVVLKRALEISPWHNEARANLGEAYFHTDRLNEAEAEFEKVVKNAPEMTQANYYLGRIAEERGLLDKAEEYYERVLKKDPEFLLAVNKRAGIFLKKGDFHRALSLFKRVLEKRPHDTEANSNLGVVYGNLGFLDLAVKHFRIALESDPGNENILQNLSFANQRLKAREGR